MMVQRYIYIYIYIYERDVEEDAELSVHKW
jgi:hypothetical protein